MTRHQSNCDHLYHPVATIQGITGIVYQNGQQTGQRVATARDKDVWVYQCSLCGWRFETDNEQFNKT